MTKTYWFLWILCIIGNCAVIPYAHSLGLIDASISLNLLLLISILQSALLYGLILWLCSKIIPRTDLHPFSQPFSLRETFLPALIAGVAVGLVIILIDVLVFDRSYHFGPSLAGMFASLYGAVNEEVLLRLFLFSLIYLVLGNLPVSRTSLLWITNVLVALVFGIGHLPAASKIMPLNTLNVFRILFLNGIGGLVFGWLYGTRGFVCAALAHFFADIVLHAL